MSLSDAQSPAFYRPILERGRWYAGLPPAQRAQLLANAVLQKVPAGASLFLRGDDSAALYCILDGAVCISAVGMADRDAVLVVLGPSHWFGEIAFIDDGPRTHDAHARVPTTLLMVPRQAMSRLLLEQPQWWRYLGQLLAEKVRAMFTTLEDLTALSASVRVARRLTAMAQGHGMLAPGLAQRRVEVNQEQLGAMLSLTRQTVSEVLRAFETRGVVKRSYGAVEIIDWAALVRLGDGG